MFQVHVFCIDGYSEQAKFAGWFQLRKKQMRVLLLFLACDYCFKDITSKTQ